MKNEWMNDKQENGTRAHDWSMISKSIIVIKKLH